MAKYHDKLNAGKSSAIPFKRGESGPARHERRRRGNLELLPEFRSWCLGVGIRFSVKNFGHHWQLFYEDRVAEWWPSSAKLVFDKQWIKGIHVHDCDQLKAMLRKRWDLHRATRETGEGDAHSRD